MTNKILVTLGPSSMSGEIIEQMSDMGVSLFRLNLSHTDGSEIGEKIELVRRHTSVPLCLDSEGAQIRTRSIKNGSALFKKNSTIRVDFDGIMGDESNISFTPEGIAKQFRVNDVLRIDFNHAAIRIIEKNRNHLLAQVTSEGVIGSMRAVDLDREIPLPAITPKDKLAIETGLDAGIRNFALSFANTPECVKQFRSLTGRDARIISKIESRRGLLNLKSILAESDEILIDRGDLSRQIVIEKIPFLQRRIISIARIMDKPVNVATNLLESMIKNLGPTRAEVNDIVSTILMGADGLVLAAETAIGKYPVEAVRIVKSIISLCRMWTPNTNISEIMEM